MSPVFWLILFIKLLKKRIMRKNLLLFGALISAFLLASCSGGNKSQSTTSVSTANVEDAMEVVKYYNTSLSVLKDVVNEKDVNAVLGYMEQKGKAPALTPIASCHF